MLLLLLLDSPGWAGGWLVLQEIQYASADPEDRGEFIEIISTDPPWIDLTGYTLEGDIYFRFPEGIQLRVGQTVVVARDPEFLRPDVAPEALLLGPWRGHLGNRSGEVRLYNQRHVLCSEVRYECGGDWPATCSGTGHSLSLRDPYTDTLDPASWFPSRQFGGTPGQPNRSDEKDARPPTVAEGFPVIINEVVPGPDGESLVELRNLSYEPVDLSGWFVTAHPLRLRAVELQPRTIIPPRGYLVASRALAIEGDTPFVALVDSSALWVRDAVRLRKAQPGQAQGRLPPYRSSQMVVNDHPTPGEPNALTVETDLVINELMYNPPSGSNEHEYIELLNRGDRSLDLSGYRIAGGVRFTFPESTTLEPGAFLVVASDPTQVAREYRVSSSQIVGPFRGTLGNGCDTVTLLDREEQVVDRVRYADGGEWDRWADGNGSSLELTNPYLDNSLASAWRASDETEKSSWESYTYVGEHREFQGESIPELQFMLLGPGECLLDDVHMGARTDLVADGSFEGGALGWIPAGTHERSGPTQADARRGKACYHLIADDAGDPRDNFVTLQIERGLVPDRQYRLLFRARWLRGCPLLLTRTGGQGVAQLHRLKMPKQVGTPGAPNSTYLESPPPAIGAISQRPAVPEVNQPTTVTARVSSPSGLDEVVLHWCREGEPYSDVPMRDDGQSGDGEPGDGVYAGVIPGEAASRQGQLIEFTITAQGSGSGESIWPELAPDRTAVFSPGLQRGANLPTYSLLVTQAQWNAMDTGPRMSDQLAWGSLVYNDRIIHGVGFRRRGSPFHRRGGGNWRVELPPDQTIDGRDALNFDNQGLGARSERGLQERTVFWLLDRVAQTNVRLHYVYFRIPGREEGIFEDVERVTGGYRDRWWPGDADGFLHKVDDYFEMFADGTQKFIEAELKFKGTDPELYRWNFPIMGGGDQENYEPLIRFIAFMDPDVTPNAQFGRELEKVLDVESFARVLGVRSYCDDWDSMGSTRGKNAFLYYPQEAKRWFLIAWDCDLTFRNPQQEFIPNKFPAIVRLASVPRVNRQYMGTMWYLANGPLAPERIGEVLEDGIRISAANPDAIVNFCTARAEKFRAEYKPGPPLQVTGVKRKRQRGGEPDHLVVSGVGPAHVMRFFLEGQEAQVLLPDRVNWVATFLVGPEGGDLELAAADAGGRVLDRTRLTVPRRRNAAELPVPSVNEENIPLDPEPDAWAQRCGKNPVPPPPETPPPDEEEAGGPPLGPPVPELPPPPVVVSDEPEEPGPAPEPPPEPVDEEAPPTPEGPPPTVGEVITDLVGEGPPEEAGGGEESAGGAEGPAEGPGPGVEESPSEAPPDQGEPAPEEPGASEEPGVAEEPPAGPEPTVGEEPPSPAGGEEPKEDEEEAAPAGRRGSMTNWILAVLALVLGVVGGTLMIWQRPRAAPAASSA